MDRADAEAEDDGDAGEEEGVPKLAWALPGSLQGHVIRPGIVHRLDKGTTGLLVVAKDDATLAGLAAQFKAHTVGAAPCLLCKPSWAEEGPCLRTQPQHCA
jgi:hypothetical protein